MSLNGNTSTSFSGTEYIGNVNGLVQWINENLQKYSDKDWNYSRLRLKIIHVTSTESPYLLGCELIDMGKPQGDRLLKDVQGEISWGDYHSSELGILELISLRLNKALLGVVGHNYYLSGDPPKKKHPVIRLVKRQVLIEANTPTAIWYEVQEVIGEEFDNR